MKAIKLFQGYLWHPKDLEFSPRQALPATLTPDHPDAPVYVLIDAMDAPFTFFEDGTMTNTQQFYQVTVLIKSQLEPADFKAITPWIQQVLNPHLNATPAGVGWQLLEDLRQI
jgi:hypothetical protein